MLMKDPKKSIALLIAGPKKMEDSPKSEEGGEYDPSIAYKSAAEEILAAVESKDPGALVEALKSFHEMCMNEPEPEEETPEMPLE